MYHILYMYIHMYIYIYVNIVVHTHRVRISWQPTRPPSIRPGACFAVLGYMIFGADPRDSWNCV